MLKNIFWAIYVLWTQKEMVVKIIYI